MPERQSSPGEVSAARPETDPLENGGPPAAEVGPDRGDGVSGPPAPPVTRAPGPGGAPVPPARPDPSPAPEAEAHEPDLDGPTVRTPAHVPGSRGPEAADPDLPTAVSLPAGLDGPTMPVGSHEPAATEDPTTVDSAAVSPVDPGYEFAGSESETEVIPVSPPPPGETAGPAGPDSGSPATPPIKRRGLLIAAGVVGALALLYGGDLAVTSGSVPRGVTVSGIDVGGLSPADAETKLRTEIEPRTVRPVAVTVGEAKSEIDPTTAGLSVDWPATLDRAGSQPLNPITRISSFFTTHEVGIVTATNRTDLDAALTALSPIVDREPAEGTVRFEGTTPVPVEPVPGQRLDVPAAGDVLEREWAGGQPVALPQTVLPPVTTTEQVTAAIDTVARPALSAPVVVTGEGGTESTLTPDVIATLLTFRADPTGLVPEVNVEGATEALKPGLAKSETPGKDAALDFSSGQPVITPSKDGRGVDYPATLKDLLPVLTGTGERKITAVYADQPAKLTTEQVKALGITGVIGEFTTRGFAPDSGRNIKRAAQVINGTIVKPGGTFSLNGATDPRDAAHGYVEAGIINDGHASRGVGGGVSQVATTTYNAAYFAGMVDVQHKEHSFFISRYPAGREATVFGSAIDLKFRNDNPTGIMIQTVWTPDSITVRIYGTKRYEVTSTPGPRTNPTQPTKVSIPKGEPCSPSIGAPGFTITDTRTLREISTGKVRSEKRTVKYNPSPIVDCGGGGDDKKKDDDDD